ncbi:hypothetical protein SDRG_16697 [Saprolegnia diclina VS20]|uniref:CDC20/Fizzy WD40 domain-containing protein n=1 Tax=Saprolegnia diclina (strain VS20) TaxID=1156394 RepID=T0PT77_SAPDV|nr:hypothetical protein SDRG_16697 [Saprolegnia diclina VS20]EQC25431.1 hypothetical protein SDRG_16697 [Saprolegnia diclina VS20]|eukprot:XP_008621137.1 hypothetical protein SDRG_16697 [Saprolegnia diclina VS20]
MEISALNLEDDLSGHTTPFHAALGKAVLDEYSVATVPIIEFRKRNKGLSPWRLPRALGDPSASLPSSPVIYHPKKSLDAPNLLDDYYTNALTWVSSDTFAVALGPAVYLYNTRTNSISELTTLRGDIVAATSLLHLPPGDLAIGTSRGHTEIWDVAAERIKVRYRSHNFRVGSLATDESILTSGSMDSKIIHHDTRMDRCRPLATLGGHFGEVCGLQWSSDGTYLASGASDHLVCVWKKDFNSRRQFPLHTIRDHCAAVKALAWRPLGPSAMLATGGGRSDRTIKQWRVSVDACTLLRSTDAGAQVTGLLWSLPQHHAHDELLASQGSDVVAYSAASMSPTAKYVGDAVRVLNLAQSPTGGLLVTSGAHEVVQLWDGRPRLKFGSTQRRKPTPSSSMLDVGQIR